MYKYNYRTSAPVLYDGYRLGYDDDCRLVSDDGSDDSSDDGS